MPGNYHKDPQGPGVVVCARNPNIGEAEARGVGKFEDCMHYIVSLNLAWAT